MKKYIAPVVELQYFVEDIVTESMQKDAFDEYFVSGNSF